jgi:hypothetical protein
MAWSDRLAADLGSPVKAMLAHILAWASTRPISTIEILDWVDPLSVSPRSATHRHCRRCVSAVLPKRIGSQSLRLSEFLGSGNQEADWRSLELDPIFESPRSLGIGIAADANRNHGR